MMEPPSAVDRHELNICSMLALATLLCPLELLLLPRGAGLGKRETIGETIGDITRWLDIRGREKQSTGHRFDCTAQQAEIGRGGRSAIQDGVTAAALQESVACCQ